MKRKLRQHLTLSFLVAATALCFHMPAHAQTSAQAFIEVNGTTTLNIAPDRITVEIEIEEYFRPDKSGDSTVVRLRDIERSVRKELSGINVPDSLIITSDLGNYRDRRSGGRFLMAKSISATLTDYQQLDRLSEKMSMRGIRSFRIARLDNSMLETYNRQGLKGALDAARAKAEFIAENEGLVITTPLEIIETGINSYGMPAVSNAAYDAGGSMENMRHITRRYNVRVRYLFSPKSN